ncbi:MAG: glycosyltransferase [Candidatus Methanoperedens sp.]|nr:glycosyltransferase [Candidatus Methanoperedens sp.]
MSVIMNCYNSSTYLREAIDSVYAQTYGDWEIIFWDNASTDKSAEIAKSYDEKLQYFHAEKTVPLGYARNLAIEKARGEYIAFLDCDDVWLPEKLEKQIGFLESHQDVAMVYSDILSIDGNGKLIENYLQKKKFYRGNIFDRLLIYNFIAILTVVLRKKIMDEVGMFDASYMIDEDYELFLRIAESHNIDFYEKPLAKYRIHGNNLCRKTDILVKEQLQILNYWMGRKDISIKVWFLVNFMKLRLYLRLLKFYISNSIMVW